MGVMGRGGGAHLLKMSASVSIDMRSVPMAGARADARLLPRAVCKVLGRLLAPGPAGLAARSIVGVGGGCYWQFPALILRAVL